MHEHTIYYFLSVMQLAVFFNQHIVLAKKMFLYIATFHMMVNHEYKTIYSCILYVNVSMLISTTLYHKFLVMRVIFFPEKCISLLVHTSTKFLIDLSHQIKLKYQLNDQGYILIVHRLKNVTWYYFIFNTMIPLKFLYIFY